MRIAGVTVFAAGRALSAPFGKVTVNVGRQTEISFTYPQKKESNCVGSGTGGGHMIRPPLPTHFVGNFRSKISHTSKCNIAETPRFAGLGFLIRAIFQDAAYEIPPAYLGKLHQSYCFRQKRKVQALNSHPPFLF
jgi:hypothetical protein